MILLTGGSGLLGQHLKIKAERPSHFLMNIDRPLEPRHYNTKYDLIVHAAAYTQVEAAETKKYDCFQTNVVGTLNLLTAFPNTPFVYISSEYAKDPINFYSLTKNMAEQLVERHPKHLIIRTLFKPRPWKYPYAFADMWTQGDYVDIIAPMIEEAIKNWDHKSKMIYIGTGRKTIFDLARQSRPDVKPNSINDIKTVKLPADYK